MNSTAKLAALDLDVAPTAALSATTNGNTLLISDSEGRIWYYASQPSQPLNPLNFSLQHKVWGGSYAGFANGLRLAAVDWDDDGDLDCLCGTAEGKLMLLRDPKVGRPTNLKADAGVDNVKLDWDPNAQSRVRGYRVYRGDEAKGEGQGEQWNLLNSTQLPTYRDTGLAAGDYAYKVSALSRFYTAGNSTPTVTESVATEPVVATVGGVTFAWSEPVTISNGFVEVRLSIDNSLNYNATGLVVSNVYDATKWRFHKVLPSGLGEKLTWTTRCEGGAAGTPPPHGVVSLAVTAGEVAAGGGLFFTFVFEDLTAEPPALMGDIDGNGVLEAEAIDKKTHAKRGDLWLMGQLIGDTARKPTAYQLKVGDFNGNGKLDNADYQALRDLLKELGVL